MDYNRQIAQLEAMRDGITEEIDGQIDRLTKEIKFKAVDYGASVKGATMQAIWCKPRIKWDAKALDGYATGGHPELFAFRTEGMPSVRVQARRK